MASLTIRNLDESLKTKLRLQSAQHGCSMELRCATSCVRFSYPPQRHLILLPALISVLQGLMQMPYQFLNARQCVRRRIWIYRHAWYCPRYQCAI